MAQAMELAGKVAIVTGAGNPLGIGAATARALGRAGARVILADLGRSEVEVAASNLAEEGLDAVARELDLAEEQSVAGLLAWVREHYGRLDVLDNNAASQGQSADQLIEDMSVELWDQIMRVNARGTMLMCKHAVPLMIAGDGGSIINISSGTALAGDFYATAYAATKGAINTLTKYVATQYGSKGIRCNAILPGIIMTPVLQATLPPPAREAFRKHSLTGLLGQPEDIAEAVLFLASDRSRFVTGQTISVDGGIFAHIPSAFDLKALFDQATNAGGSGA